MADRLQRFRDYMERCDAAADPRHAIERGLYVPPPGRSVAEQAAGRLELQPSSSHLLAGGTGSGKTTELLVVEQRLNQRADTQAIYIDVGAEHDLGKLVPGVLVVLAGLKLSTLLLDELEVRAAREHFQGRARGRQYYARQDDELLRDDRLLLDDARGEVVTEPGILVPPLQPKVPDLLWQDHVQIEVLVKALRRRTPHLTLLFDSLDRRDSRPEMEVFEQVVANDISVLKSLGIGVVLVGPLKLLYGTWRPIANQFDKFYPVMYSDPGEEEGRQFLLRVLSARSLGKLLSDDAASRVAELSGGHLRDLISLARDAAEEAYLSGSETILPVHVEASADALGRSLVVGLLDEDVADLQRLRAHGTFVPASDREFALLMGRRVIQYGSGPTRYALHPTVRPLLEQLATQP